MTTTAEPCASAPARGLVLASSLALASVALARLPWRRPEGGLAHLWLAEEAVASLAVTGLWLASRWRTNLAPRAPLPAGAITGWLLALLATELLTAMLAANPWAAARASTLVLVGVATFLLARQLGAAGRAVPLLTLALIGGGVLAEAFGLWPGASRAGHAPGGFLGERNAAGQLLAAGLPLVGCEVLTAASAGRRRLALGLVALDAAAITLCRTRSAWLAVLLLGGLTAASMLGAGSRRQAGARRPAIALLVVALAGFLVPAFTPSALRWSSRHPYRDTALHLVDTRTPSAAGRLVQYATTLRMAAAHPLLGVGPGNWSGQYLAFADREDPTLSAAAWPVNRLPSSDVFGFLAERGALGALCLLGLVVALLRGQGPARWLTRATLFALLPLCVFDAVLQLAPALLVVAWVLGSAHDDPSSAADKTPAIASALQRGGQAGLSLALVAASALSLTRVDAFRQFMHARDLDALERSVWLDPGDLARALFVAEVAVESGRCDRALPLVAMAARRATETRAGRALAARCRP